MRKNAARAFIAVALLSCGLAFGATAGDLLWDNNLEPSGAGGRALSPPGFPSIRVVEDIVVGSPGWRITGFFATVIEDSAWGRNQPMEIYIYGDSDREPTGDPTLVHTGYEVEDTGRQLFSRQVYIYRANDLQIELPAGRWWIGFRMPEGSGSGTNYWLDSDGGADGGPGGPGEGSGYFSVDGGQTWNRNGSEGPYSFEVHGELLPAPAALALLGVAGFATRRRRRR